MPKPYSPAEIPLAMALAMGGLSEADIDEALAEHRNEARRAALLDGAAIAAEVSTDSTATAAVRATIVAALRVAALANDECAQCSHRRGDHLNHGAFCTLPTSATTVCGCRRYAHPTTES